MKVRPEFRLYNSHSRKVEPVTPIEPGHLRLYACGPTVYSHAHIGNFRTFVTVDLIVRTAHAINWRTTYVTNITDVGHLTDDDLADAEGLDKMEKALQSKEGMRFHNIWDLASFYEQSVLTDWRTIRLLEPDVRPRATQHIREQIVAIEQLVGLGYAYETAQGVYFSVPSFPEYGRLSGNKAADDLEVLVRDVVKDPEKRDQRDFALWKKDSKHLMQWFSPWGWGFPGWHIECSVMATAYLGKTIDIHAGGEDLRFPHHECEIAQAEAISGEPFVRHWVHSRFLQVEGEKMSKSRGNDFTIRDLTDTTEVGGKKYDPLSVRYALLSGHYRKPFNFTIKNLNDSDKVVARYTSLRKRSQATGVEIPRIPELTRVDLRDAYERTLSALLDDLNTPVALASALNGVKILEREELDASSAIEALAYLDGIDSLLGIAGSSDNVGIEPEVSDTEQNAAIDALVAKRGLARASGDWSSADAIRDELAALGVRVVDTPEGSQWEKL